MTIHHIVDAASLSVRGLARANPIVETLRYLVSQKLRRGALVRGYVRKVAIGLCQFVYGISGAGAGFVQLPYESQGSNEVGGEILGVIKEVSDGGLSIRIHRRFWNWLQHCGHCATDVRSWLSIRQ